VDKFGATVFTFCSLIVDGLEQKRLKLWVFWHYNHAFNRFLIERQRRGFLTIEEVNT